MESEDKPVFILRENNDVFTKLDPASKKVIEIIPKHKGERTFTKIKSHIMRYVPGDDKHADVVREVYEMYFVRKLSMHHIVTVLNRRGEPTSHGNRWSTVGIRRLLMNKAYTGTIAGNRISLGSLIDRRRKEPIQFETPRRPAPGKKHLPKQLKPVEAWIEKDAPELHDFLPSKVRSIAVKWQNKEWDKVVQRSLNPNLKGPNASGRLRGGSRHNPAKHPLSGVLVNSVGSTMNGHTKNCGEREYLSRGVVGLVKKQHIIAQPIDTEVFGCLSAVLGGSARWIAAIRDYITKRQAKVAKDTTNLPKMLARREELKKEYRMIYQVYGPKGQEICAEQARQCEQEITELDRRIDAASPTTNKADSVEKIVRSVQSQLKQVISLVEKQELKSLSMLAKTFFSLIQWDHDAKVLRLDIRLPDWAMSAENTLIMQCGLVEGGARSTFYQNTPKNGLILAKYRCWYNRSNPTRVGQFSLRELIYPK